MSNFATPRTVAPLSMGFPRQEHYSELPFLRTQELNLGLLHCRQILYHWSLNIKRLSFIKESHMPQGKEFSTFLCVGRCKSLSSLKSFLSCASKSFFQSKFLSAYCREYCSLMAARSQVLFSFLSALRAQKSTFGGLDIFLYRYGRKYSFSPKSLQMVIAAMKLKDAYSLEEKL